jgi:hypothetical protein
MNTRNYITVLLMVLISSSDVRPQSAHRFSAKLGIAWTNQSAKLGDGGSVSSSKRLIVPIVGVLVDLFAGEHFSFVTGLEYQQRGVGKSKSIYNAFYLEVDELNDRWPYLSVPLLVRFRSSLNSLTPYSLAGFVVLNNLDPKYGEALVLDATFGAGIRADALLALPVFIEGRYSVNITPALSSGKYVGIDYIKDNSIDLAMGISF